MKNTFLAIDLGASSGRGILGEFHNNKVEIKEISRFENRIVNIFGHYYWDIFGLYENIKKSIQLSAKETKQLKGIAIDTWGVDFAMLDKFGNIIGLPNMYRDSRTNGVPEKLFRKISKWNIYRETGIQFMELNTLFQLYSYKLSNRNQFRYIKKILFIPNYLNYLLTGEKVNEYTIASTSQFFNPKRNDWSAKILKTIGVKRLLLGDTQNPGTILGKLHPALQQEFDLPDTDVILTASHDTASAVVSVPAKGSNWAYLSSGTWSLIGLEVDKPIITKTTFEQNFTNEGGAFGKIRFLKNVSGLWLLQECKRCWDKEGKVYSFAELAEMAKSAKPFAGFINPDDALFVKPDNMPEAINEYLRKTGQNKVNETGQIVRIILESLAFKYKEIIKILQDITGNKIEVLHVIGGGSKNDLLNQFTSDACGIPVIAGPSEATAIGNLIMQAKAKGIISSLSEGREIVRNSFELKNFEPADINAWNEAYEKSLGKIPG
jgi:rhamnulokinase